MSWMMVNIHRRNLILGFSMVLAVVAAAACWGGEAIQTPEQNHIRTIPSTADVKSPFDLSGRSESTKALLFRDQGAMTPDDSQAMNAEAQSIKKIALSEGYEIGKGNWKVQQIVCPALPQQLLLLYSRDQGLGDSSRFSAIVPLRGQGETRVLPILRRGYSPFSPAPVNPLTIAIFNQARAEEQSDEKPNWLTTSLCYAALAGVHVSLSPPRGSKSGSIFYADTPLIEIRDDATELVRFIDEQAPSRPKEWELVYDRKGKLIRVSLSSIALPKARILPGSK